MQGSGPHPHTIDASSGVAGIREAIISMLRREERFTGNGIAVSAVMPVISGSDFAYELERDILFMSAMWSLVRDGIIVPGRPAGLSLNSPRSADHAFTHFTITPFGRGFVSAQLVIHPLESDAYMRDARKRLGSSNERIYTYLIEARKSFSDGNYLSAIVMLGVSSELLMKWLIDRFIDHLPDQKRRQFEKTKNDNWFKTDKLFEIFIKTIEEHLMQERAPRDLLLQASANLDQLQTLIRVNRDDAGHGRPDRADPQLACGYLQIYLPLLTIVRELADYLSAHTCTVYIDEKTS